MSNENPTPSVQDSAAAAPCDWELALERIYNALGMFQPPLPEPPYEPDDMADAILAKIAPHHCRRIVEVEEDREPIQPADYRYYQQPAAAEGETPDPEAHYNPNCSKCGGTGQTYLGEGEFGGTCSLCYPEPEPSEAEQAFDWMQAYWADNLGKGDEPFDITEFEGLLEDMRENVVLGRSREARSGEVELVPQCLECMSRAENGYCRNKNCIVYGKTVHPGVYGYHPPRALLASGKTPT